MHWTQDGQTRIYAWSYGYSDDGMDIFIISADPQTYGDVQFVFFSKGAPTCEICFKDEPLENYCSIYFDREGGENRQRDGSSRYSPR